MTQSGGLECFWSNLDKHPTCPHGPTLLFGRYAKGELKQFYACSACRDREVCNFYADKDAKLTDPRKKARKAEGKKTLPAYNHRRLFVRFNEALAESPERRAYCHRCSKLVLFAERPTHAANDMRIGLTDVEIKNPTTILRPLSNAKKEAQYLFTAKATVEITNMLVKAGAEQVLCIGAPRIHEHISQNFERKMSSLLMDIDGRFHDFFGPLSYCWYNLFNHHFFTEEAAQIYRDFITQNAGKNMFIICDPPFGGRVESISQTIKTIADQHKKWNSIKDDETRLKIVFVFPYFMESIIQQKSNPPNTNGGLKDLKMADYKVGYDNHPLFVTGSNGRKHGSPVRIFTNISLNILELPATDGYKYCAKCKKWISAENRHCKKCNECTSKDGRRYKHCDVCQRCTKPTWKHCEVCKRCALEKHTCGVKPKVTGLCYTCGGSDHVGKDCPERIVVSAKSSSPRPGKKRKSNTNGIGTAAKKQKTSVPEQRAVPVGRIQKKKEEKKKKKKEKKKDQKIASREAEEAPPKLKRTTVKTNIKLVKMNKSTERR